MKFAKYEALENNALYCNIIIIIQYCYQRSNCHCTIDQQSSCTDECNPQFDGVQYSVCCDTDNISTFIAVKSSDSSSAAKRYIACPDYIPDWCE